jgi:hypothetical protein
MFTTCHFRLHNHEHRLLNYEHPELFVGIQQQKIFLLKELLHASLSNVLRSLTTCQCGNLQEHTFQGLCVRMCVLCSHSH